LKRTIALAILNPGFGRGSSLRRRACDDSERIGRDALRNPAPERKFSRVRSHLRAGAT
jgi:hypothetical protein